MPKPVLSDSLFNADDVATAVLAEANLQIANSAIGVTDVSSNFVIDSAWNSWNERGAFKFNGFVFLYLNAYYTGSDVNSDRTIFTISDSNLYPSEDTPFPTVSYQGDTASNVVIKTTGSVDLGSPLNQGSGDFYMTINGFYRL